MNIMIIAGSSRQSAESARIAERMNAQFFDGTADVLSLADKPLPEWDGAAKETDSIEDIRRRAALADGFVFVVPEWHGMAPACFKNLFLWLGKEQLAHKPALIVAVSSGVGGAMVVAELRSSSYKNSRIAYIPEHLIIRDVANIWREDIDHPSNGLLYGRAAWCIDMLKAYAEALKPVQAIANTGFPRFPNGMS
jgi:multimeric flavodoxin WrbA